MTPSIRSAILLFTLLSAALTASAGDRYVSGTGLDANDGSAAHPFRQIRRALTSAAPGDNILVADGDYLGFDIDSVMASAGAPLTIRATGSAANILPTTDRSDNRDTIHILSSTYITIDGFRSFNATRAALRIDACNSVTVKNCVFGDNQTWGIFTNHSNDSVFINNECYGSKDQHGIYNSNSGDRPVLRGNRIHDNVGCGLHFNGDISTGGSWNTVGDGIISGAIVEGNIIYNNGAPNGGSAINMDSVQDSIIRNNLLYNNHASGICIYHGDGSAGPKGMQIYHNTIDMAADGRWAIQLSETTGMNTVRNNIMYNRNASRGGLAMGAEADVANVDSDYNIFGGAAYITPDGWTTRVTLANWQSTRGKEMHSRTALLADLWINPATPNPDYHLKAGSPAVDNALLLLTVLDDMDGHARLIGSAPAAGTGTDIGAYEQPSPPNGLYGDGNNDGQFTLADLNLMVDWLLMRTARPQWGTAIFTRCDVNGSGTIEMADLNLYVDKLLGRIGKFPVEP
jgi:parallel beta-helix repeat protein